MSIKVASLVLQREVVTFRQRCAGPVEVGGGEQPESNAGLATALNRVKEASTAHNVVAVSWVGRHCCIEPS
jgi:hypothetical protein